MPFKIKSFAFVFFILSSNIYADPDLKECQNTQCQAVIDAGSSGTRIYIYAKTTKPIAWKQVLSKKVTPGLSSISPASVGTYMDELVQVVPETPMSISLYGTAGMRLLSEQEQQLRYQAAQQWFQSHPQWLVKSIRTISGQEEGVFGWLAVQSEMHLLNQPLQKLKSVIEVGGASTQVTIPVSKQELGKYSPTDIYTLNFNGKPMYVWSKSFLGLGLNEAEKKFSSDTYCYSQGYPLNFGLFGQGDATLCVQDLENKPEFPLFDLLQSAKEVILNHPKLNWVALGALKYVAETPPFHFEQHMFNFKTMLQIGDLEFCHQSWENLSPQAKLNPNLYRQCFGVSYFYSAFADALGLNEQVNLYFPEPQAQMDWTLGALFLTDEVKGSDEHA